MALLVQEAAVHPYDPMQTGPGRNGPHDATDMLVWVFAEMALLLAALAPWRVISANRVALGTAAFVAGAIALTPAMIYGGGLLLLHLFGLYTANVLMGITLFAAIAIEARSGSTGSPQRDKA